jgi:hypothetical protein
MKKIHTILILIVLVLVFSFIYQDEEKNIPDTLYINKIEIPVEILDIPAERTKGLSGREYLAEDTGVLFVFEEPDRYGFWMKEMKFDLDIVWMDQNFKIVHIEEALTPDTYPQIFEPESDTQYVLEVNSGFVEKNKLEVGLHFVVDSQN